MNFKDAYKSYNDEIKGNPKVLDTILNGKTENTKRFYVRPSLVGAMVAMVVIAVSVFGFNNINKTSDVSQKTYIASRGINSENASEIPDSVISPYNTAVGNDEVPAYSGDTEVNPRIAVPDDTVSDSTIVTTEECYDYFGFNVTDKARLPKDISFGGNVITNGKKSAQTGEFEYCSFRIDGYSMDNPSRIFDVFVEMQSTPIEQSGSLQIYKSDTGVVTGGEYASGNMRVSVNSINLTAPEVEELINSLFLN